MILLYYNLLILPVNYSTPLERLLKRNIFLYPIERVVYKFLMWPLSPVSDIVKNCVYLILSKPLKIVKTVVRSFRSQWFELLRKRGCLMGLRWRLRCCATSKHSVSKWCNLLQFGFGRMRVKKKHCQHCQPFTLRLILSATADIEHFQGVQYQVIRTNNTSHYWFCIN